MKGDWKFTSSGARHQEDKKGVAMDFANLTRVSDHSDLLVFVKMAKLHGHIFSAVDGCDGAGTRVFL